MKSLWHFHPAVRSGPDLTVGQRAADSMRRRMGSWSFVFAALGFLGCWILYNGRSDSFDPYPYILLNLCLSCLAALQGAILLIAGNRSEQVAAELARHAYETELANKELLEALHTKVDKLGVPDAGSGEAS